MSLVKNKSVTSTETRVSKVSRRKVVKRCIVDTFKNSLLNRLEPDTYLLSPIFTSVFRRYRYYERGLLAFEKNLCPLFLVKQFRIKRQWFLCTVRKLKFSKLFTAFSFLLNQRISNRLERLLSYNRVFYQLFSFTLNWWTVMEITMMNNREWIWQIF